MAYKQLKPFYPSDMGTKKGWCLENVARGYHIYGVPSAQTSAKADMEFNKAKGTLHPLNTLPINVAVPVYLDTASKYEHIEVSDKGVFWSDGKKVSKPASNCFGWGEYCNGVRIVEYQNDPQPSTGFLPPKGYWGRYDKDTRVAELASFMRKVFPAYTPSSALGPIYGDNLWKSMVQFQKNARADGNYNAEIDGNTGPKTYEALKKYGFKG